MSRSALRRATLFLASALGALAIFAPTAFAAGPPVVNIASPGESDISLTVAHFQGTINPNGAFTSYWIEYGKTKQYGNSTPHFSLAKGESPVTVYLELVGLEGRTTYHYRIVAVNSSAKIVTPDTEFENLNDWKVGTRSLSNIGPLVGFQDASWGELEFQGLIGGVLGTRVRCSPESKASGVLGVSITSIEYSCSATVIGSPSCTSTGLSTLTLNGQMAFTEAFTVKFPIGCAAGTSLSFSKGGISVPQSPQAKEFTSELWGVAFINSTERWDVRLSPESWTLTGAEAGKLFGVGL